MRLTQALDRSHIAYAEKNRVKYYCTNMACYKEIKGKTHKIKDLNEIMGLNWKPMGV